MNIRDLGLRLKAIFLRRRVETDLQDELVFHIEMQTQKNRSRGMPVDEARRQAQLKFGGVTQIGEACRDERRVNLIENALQDIRYAFRSLRRSPGFAAVVIATIGIGLGINAIVFTAFNAYVLRPYPVRKPYSLYRLNWITSHSVQGRWLSWDEYQSFPKMSTVTETFGVQPIGPFSMDGRAAFGQLVTGNYFQMLGVNALLGRVLTPEDSARNGNSHVVVLSYTIWQSRYASDPGILGKEVSIHGQRLQVVGIARPGFLGVGDRLFDFWAPITLSPEISSGPSLFGPQHPKSLEVIGRLSSGSNPEASITELTGWITRISEPLPEPDRVRSVTLSSRARYVAVDQNLIVFIIPIFVAFGLVLLLACANVGNLMLARSVSRQREIGIRLSLGAGRFRLIRQLLTESILLAVPAELLGFVVSRLAIVFGLHLYFAEAPSLYTSVVRFMPLNADGRVLLFMFAGGLFSAVAFGLAPAIQATRSTVVQSARGDFTAQVRPGSLRNALIVTQLAISALLLIAAGVLIRGTQAVQHVEPGFDPHGVLIIYSAPSAIPGTISLLRSNPTVEFVSNTTHVPSLGHAPEAALTNRESGQTKTAALTQVSPDFFPVMRMNVVQGRNFTEEESRSEANVAIISRSVADAFWPASNAIGRSVHIAINRGHRARIEGLQGRADSPTDADERELQVVGIVPDQLTGFVAQANGDRRSVYLPLKLDSADGDLLIRVHGDAESAGRQLEAEMSRRLPGAALEIQGAEDVFQAQFFPFTVIFQIASTIGVIALAMAGAGIFGFVSFLTSQRTKEIGIRMALGATRYDVRILVVQQVVKSSALGLLVGTILATGVSALFAKSIFAMNHAFDPLAYAGAIGVVTAAAALAAFLPARRASSVDPAATLRND